MWFRLPRPLKKRIMEQAAVFGQTQSVVIVRAVEYYFEHALGLPVPEKDPTLP
jgi:predicted DNA-binding protein